MDNGLPPLEFTDCLVDSPFFRENLHIHEKELERTSQQIKRLIKDVKDLLNAAKSLSFAQRKLSRSLENFSFVGIGTTQTDDERMIQESLKEFGALIAKIEDVRDKILGCSFDQIITPLEKFRKEKIGKVKEGKKRFEKQTAKFCQSQERYLNITTKKQDSQLKEADANLDMEERELCQASLQYVFLLQEVEERKKFEFVETLLSFLVSWLAFYHQGHDVYGEFKPYMTELQLKIQKTRDNFDATRDKTESLMKKMLEMRQQKSLDPTIVKSSFTREGYLFLMEKKAFGTTWTKQYCRYKKDTKEFEMIPYNQMTAKSLNSAEKIRLASCTRRMSDSIEKRFCFDLISAERPNIVYTLQALSEADRKMWLDAMDGKEPTYASPGNIPKTEERQLDEIGINFVKKCIETLEVRGLEEQGLYRIVGVNSKVNKLLSMGLDRRKAEKLNLHDPFEWESKTITSALKNYLRNLPEPLMTYKLHESFIEAVKRNTNVLRINGVHTLVHRLPQPNLQIMDILIRHLVNVAAKSEKNLMSISNLGVCFGPTLLRPEEETVAAILNIKFCNIVVEILIENYEKIFKTEPEVIDIDDSKCHSQSSHREGNHKFISQQQHQSIYGHITQIGNSGVSSTQASTSTTSHIRPPIRHMYTVHQNPPTHAIMKTAFKEGTATVNMSSSLNNVPSGMRDKEFLTRMESNSAGDRADLGHTTSFWADSPSGPVVSTVSTFSESNLQSISTHPPYEFIKSRPGYQYTNAALSDRQEVLNSNSSSNESVSSRDSNEVYGSNEIFKKEHYSSEFYQESDFFKRNPGFRKDTDSYGSPELYSSVGSIPQKSSRRVGIHPLPLYRSQPDNVIPYSYSSKSPKLNISSSNETILRRVRTLYACLGENDGELSFDPNQIITNVRPSLEPGWLEGTLNGKTGLIPENYVEILP